MNPPSFLKTRFVLVPITCCACFILAGCADNEDKTIQQRQKSALDDPMGYGPKPSDVGSDVPTVTRGSMSDGDKSGFRRDLDKVFNP